MEKPTYDSTFDPEAHEAWLAEYYARQEKYAIFDQIVDLALDGQISMDEALEAFIEIYPPEA